MKPTFTVMLCAVTLACSAPASADPWKDESGKQWHGDYEHGDWSDDYDRVARRYGEHFKILRPPSASRRVPGLVWGSSSGSPAPARALLRDRQQWLSGTDLSN